MAFHVRAAFSLALGLAVAATTRPSRADEAEPSQESAGGYESDEVRWCADELVALSERVCVALPNRVRQPPTLVVFLHGVVKPGTGWQWAQQRALARAAAVHGFVGVMPRGRRGHGPRGMEDWWTWPTSAVAQRAFEGELLTEWAMAEHALVGALGEPFARRYVLGFSNGAYYASSLALRGRLAADGFGVFAGGSGAEYLVAAARSVEARPPIYVGYGQRDETARRDARHLGAALRTLGWPCRVVERPRVGHTMTDSMVAEALSLFSDRDDRDGAAH